MQQKISWGSGSSTPLFAEPIYFAKKPTDGTVYYSHNHQPAVTWCDNGDLLAIWYTCDAEASGSGGTSIHLSGDNGLTWSDPWNGKRSTFYDEGTGSSIAGIHAQIVELKDGSLMAFGRGDAIDGKMPCSISTDGGKTWTYSATQFPPIGSGQRHVLLRLKEGPIMLASFSGNDKKNNAGIFVSISEDEGKTLSTPKLLTDGKTRTLDGGAHTGTFTMSATQSEPAGYFCGTQTPDGTIHLLSSAIHYRINLAWIKE